MSNFDRNILAMTYFGLFFALILVLAGLIIFRWPHLCTSFSAMTPEQLKNVDLKAVSRDSLMILGGTGAACAILYYSLYYTGHYTIAIELCVIALLAGCIVLAAVLRKHDRNPGRKKGTVALAVTAVFAVAICIMLFSWSRPVKIHVEGDSLEIDGAYGMTVPLQDIRQAKLIDTLPEIEMRTNGIGLGYIQTGHFRLKDIGACRLYVNMKFSPYVQLTLADGQTVIFNTSDSELTEHLYETCISF